MVVEEKPEWVSLDEFERGLVMDAVRGDREALGLLLTRSDSAVRAHVERAIRRAPRPYMVCADDVLQDICMDAVEAIATFRSSEAESFLPWLNRIADRRMATIIRVGGAWKRGGLRRQYCDDLSCQ